MKPLLLILLSLAMCSCSTTVSEGGKPVLKTYANMTGVEFRTPAGTYLKADRIDHSTPTRAAGSVVGTAATGISGILTSGAIIP